MPAGGVGRKGADRREPTSADPVVRLATNGGIGTLNDVLKALAHPRRRIVLYHLQAEQRATVDELARQIAAEERGYSPEDAPAEARERIMSELVHTHLPQLADLHFIEYDPRSLMVAYVEPPALLDTVLEILAQFEGGPDSEPG